VIFGVPPLYLQGDTKYKWFTHMANNTFQFGFIIHKAKANNKGESPILAKITVNGKPLRVSTGIRTKGDTWENQKIKGRTPTIKACNDKLDLIKSDFLNLFNTYRNGENITVEKIVALYKGVNIEEEKKITFSQVAQIQIQRKTKEKESGMGTQRNVRKYEVTKEKFLDYLKEDIPVNQINEDHVHGFEVYLNSLEKHTAQQSVNKELMRLRSFLKIANKKGYLLTDPFDEFKYKRFKVKIDFYTADELKKAEDATIFNERLDIVRDIGILFSSYTSLAYGEYSKLTWDHIMTHTNNQKYIHIDRNKTVDRGGNSCIIPLLPKALAILDKYKDHPVCIAEGKCFPIISNQKMNLYLKEVATLLGIKANAKFKCHTGRKTFATTIAMNNDLPIETISAVMGHGSITMTQKFYAQILNEKVFRDMDQLKERLANVVG
jgi:integrase/recombinase XerD